jgi:hypothetical protein
VAPSQRDGAGSSRVGIAGHGERSVFRSMLGLGRTFLISHWKVLLIALEGARAV